MTKLTVAELTALQHVRDGRVKHRFHADGNVYDGPSGPGARSYDRLERLGLIDDGSGEGKMPTIYAVLITFKGQTALATGEAP